MGHTAGGGTATIYDSPWVPNIPLWLQRVTPAALLLFSIHQLHGRPGNLEPHARTVARLLVASSGTMPFSLTENLPFLALPLALITLKVCMPAG